MDGNKDEVRKEEAAVQSEQKDADIKPNGTALFPFIVFVGVYLGAGIILQMQGVEMPFYQFPAPLASIIGIIVAFALLRGQFSDKFNTFIEGCGNPDILIMCMIFLLAGGFAVVCKAMGGIDSTVNLGLTYIPPQYLAAGVFLISAFISTATGTSVGCCAAVGPIAVAIAEKSGTPLGLVLGCLVGGAMLGDNLSIISDTTIASTRTQGCEMKDKFKLNLWLAIVPAVITFVLLVIFGGSDEAVRSGEHPYSLIKILPYIVVLVTAVAGVDVFLVLVGGTVLAGIIGMAYGDLTFLSFMQAIYKGFSGMFDIFLLSLLTGGLAAMVSRAGGIAFLLHSVEKFITGSKSAQIGISGLVSITDIALANNTVSIIINGEMAKKLCYRFKVDPRRSAALLSTFSSIFQGLIPYGAQMLIVTGFTAGAVSPLEVLPYTWFLYLLAISAIMSIFVPFSDGFIRKDPWNYEHETAQARLTLWQNKYGHYPFTELKIPARRQGFLCPHLKCRKDGALEVLFNKLTNRFGLVNFYQFFVCFIIYVVGTNGNDISVRRALIFNYKSIFLRIQAGRNSVVRVYASQVHIIERTSDLSRIELRNLQIFRVVDNVCNCCIDSLAVF